ncbi:glycoside hydrolase family 105 protein [Vibrio sinensis]|uniref:Glycoside hydrolase family 105 protein n=1 Tax=Vibrio sinensis TaxID=2302434 RepID=A0A3A6R2A2_9VIBR|nr:glycoside hydrolase family 88 protein [Vibrio sinensis]RJX75257.1 glycoside hydrolase family 105 protein [Vibrio sinensis]
MTQDHIKQLMKRVYTWQFNNRTRFVIRSTGKKRFLRATDWERGVFWLSVADAWQATDDQEYLDGLMDWTLHTGFRAGHLPRFADDHVCMQAYIPMYPLMDSPELIEYAQKALEVMIDAPKPGREDWWWCDSLFMAPPVFAAISSVTGDSKYIDYMDTAFWDAVDNLYDAETGLYYRDQRYIPNAEQTEFREANGEKVMWSRGLGWVLGCVPRILDHMPEDYPTRHKYIEMFQALAKEVIKYQQEDGFWRVSLLDPESFPMPESSATSLFVYGLAWGLNQGLLDQETYMPVVTKAWSSLETCIHEDGMIGWVQLPAYNPRKVEFDHNIDYGAGAFLLAATQMMKL